jgi:hypothetical protein
MRCFFNNFYKKSVIIIISNIALLCAPCITQGQSNLISYKVDYLRDSYNNLENDSTLWSDEFWVDSLYPSNGWDINLDPNLKFSSLNQNFDQLTVWFSNLSGWLSNSNYTLKVYPLSTYIREYSDTAPFQTKFSYKIDTINNTQVVKVQFKQLGLTDSTYVTKGYANIQLWFYYGGTFEIRYGNSSVPNNLINNKFKQLGKYKPFIISTDFKDTSTNRSNIILLSSDYASPKISLGTTVDFINQYKDSSLSQFPPSGTVYRFTTWKVGLLENDLQAGNFNVYPNPFITELNLTINPAHFKQMVISNAMGKQIYCGIPLNKLHTGQWQPGIYFVSLTNLDDKISYQKVIKAEN